MYGFLPVTFDTCEAGDREICSDPWAPTAAKIFPAAHALTAPGIAGIVGWYERWDAARTRAAVVRGATHIRLIVPPLLGRDPGVW